MVHACNEGGGFLREALAQAGELLLPVSCAGCDVPGYRLCPRCRAHLASPPRLIRRALDVGAPIWALGPYSQVRRNLIVAMKELNNQWVRPHLGAVYAAGLEYLSAQGELPAHLTVIPAPTRARSARRRGGDPMLHIAQAVAESSRGRIQLNNAVKVSPHAPDQSGLSASERAVNMRTAVQLRGIGKRGRLDASRDTIPDALRDAVVLDDVVTTGATLAATVARLRAAGWRVRGCLVLAEA